MARWSTGNRHGDLVGPVLAGAGRIEPRGPHRSRAAVGGDAPRTAARRARRAKQPSDRDATGLGAAAYVTLYGPGYADRQRLKDLIAARSGAYPQAKNVLALITQADLLSYEMDYLSEEEAKKLKARP
jgi:hypothetical protein